MLRRLKRLNSKVHKSFHVSGPSNPTAFRWLAHEVAVLRWMCFHPSGRISWMWLRYLVRTCICMMRSSAIPSRGDGDGTSLVWIGAMGTRSAATSAVLQLSNSLDSVGVRLSSLETPSCTVVNICTCVNVYAQTNTCIRTYGAFQAKSIVPWLFYLFSLSACGRAV